MELGNSLPPLFSLLLFLRGEEIGDRERTLVAVIAFAKSHFLLIALALYEKETPLKQPLKVKLLIVFDLACLILTALAARILQLDVKKCATLYLTVSLLFLSLSNDIWGSGDPFKKLKKIYENNKGLLTHSKQNCNLDINNLIKGESTRRALLSLFHPDNYPEDQKALAHSIYLLISVEVDFLVSGGFL